MSPARSVDTERQDEFLTNKQFKQGSSKLVRRNLPTLIEASPDFNKKQLPYLPNLPPSVQFSAQVPSLSATSPNLQNWFDQKRWEVLDGDENQYFRSRRDRAAYNPSINQETTYFRPNSRSESVSSIGFGSTYGGSTISKRSRSSSITFLQDLSPPRSKEKKKREEREKEKGRKSRKEKENRAKKQELETQAAIFAEEKEEILQRPGGKSGKSGKKSDRDNRHCDSDRERNGSNSDRESSRKEKGGGRNREKEQGGLWRKSHSYSGLYQETRDCSMWSCCRCTLENPLVEATCLACGGSRLCSIGEINVEKLGINQATSGQNQVQDASDGRWICLVCTLKNDQFAHYCDACNSINPNLIDKKDEKNEPGSKLAPGQAAVPGTAAVGQLGVVNTTVVGGFTQRLPRYAAIATLIACFLYFIANVLLVIANYAHQTLAAASLKASQAADVLATWRPAADQLILTTTSSADLQTDQNLANLDQAHDYLAPNFGPEFLGLNLWLLAIFYPVFFLLLVFAKKTTE